MPGAEPASPLGEQLRQHVGARVEFLDAMIAHVHDIDGSIRRVNRNAAREIELAIVVAKAAPLHNELTR